MYDPENGYAATGATYSPDFVDRYVTAQGERHRRVMALAQDRMTLIESGDGPYPDDEPFLVHGVNARIWMPDLRLLGRTRGAYPVLRRDGSMETEVAHSTRPPSGSAQVSRSYASAITGVSVRQFLSSHSVSTTSEYAIGEDEIRGIKWATSNTSTPSNLAGVTTPLLIAAMGAHYFLVPSEIAYEHAASQDKQLVIIEGANHFFMPCEATEPTPGAWGDTVKTLFDYVDGWVAERFV
jgi:hypothetical protein